MNFFPFHSMQWKPTVGWIWYILEFLFFNAYFENLVEDEYGSLLRCLPYKVIRKKYGDLLDEHDNSNVILKSPPRMMSTYMCAFFSNWEFYNKTVTLLTRKGVSCKMICLFGPIYVLKLTCLQTILQIMKYYNDNASTWSNNNRQQHKKGERGLVYIRF